MSPITVNCDLVSRGQKVIQLRGRAIRLHPLVCTQPALYFHLKCEDVCREPAQMTHDLWKTFVALEQQQEARQTNCSHLSYAWPMEPS